MIILRIYSPNAWRVIAQLEKKRLEVDRVHTEVLLDTAKYGFERLKANLSSHVFTGNLINSIRYQLISKDKSSVFPDMGGMPHPYTTDTGIQNRNPNLYPLALENGRSGMSKRSGLRVYFAPSAGAYVKTTQVAPSPAFKPFRRAYDTVRPFFQREMIDRVSAVWG